MITIIDKYIIKKYLYTFFFIMLIFTLIAIVFDFSEKVDDFIKEDCTKQEIFFDYYLNFIPWINSILLPFYALISVVFVTSRLANNSEIVALLGAGAKFSRILRPFLISAGLIAILHLFAGHIMVPKGNKPFKEFENKYIFKGNIKDKNRNVHIFITPDTKIYLRYYRKRDSSGVDFRIEQFKNNEMVYLLKSERIKLLEYPNKWRLEGYVIRSFDGDKEGIIVGKGAHLDTTINLTPADFVFVSNEKEMMTTPELYDYIDSQRMKGVGTTSLYEVEAHRRTSEPFTILILTIIGVAMAGRKVRGGMGLYLALAIMIGAVYIFLSKVSITFATNKDFPPLLAVWIPNIIFGLLAIYLVKKAQK